MTEPTPSSLTLGRILFKFRSFTPVPVILLLGYLLWRTRGAAGPGGELVDMTLNVLGVAVAVGGQALRFYTLGLVSDGTSGQGNQIEASQLNNRGPYAYVRNPLYVGNFLIVLGLLLVAHSTWVYVIALAFFFGEYFFIIRAEEDFLRAKFGPVYEDFLQKVPRWVPRTKPAYEGKLKDRFDTLRAIKKEHNPFAAWATGIVLLQAWEFYARDLLNPAGVAMLVALEAVVLAVFVVSKAYKRGWIFAQAKT